MATNAFLPFATAPGANVASAADYTANSSYAIGFQAGVATSKYLNFTWRQSSFMASALGQLIADYGLVNAVDDGSISNLENALVVGIQGATPGRLIALRVFTASGTYTPTTGTKSIVVEVVGGGGAGGAAQGTGASQISGGAGGGAGGRAIKRMAASAQTITIGAGGIGNNTGAGPFGSASSFGSVISAAGGAGGAYGLAGAVGSTGGGLGGASTGGDINAPGATGGGVFGIAASNLVLSGSGASTPYGGGGPSTSGYNTGPAASGYGAGGAGGSATANNGNAASGGNGSPGLVIIYEYA